MSPADERPFLEAILSRDADDGPRLVFADYLDESGEPGDAVRAQLIRVQVALARLPDDHDLRPELVEREAEILHRHRQVLKDPFASLGVEVEFRRGIADSVSVDAGTFLTVARGLFDRTRVGPGGRSQVRRVQLLEPAPVLPRLIHCRYLAEIDELVLCGSLGNSGLHLLLESPFLTSLRSLDLGFNGLDDCSVRRLAGSATLSRLEVLVLNDNRQITWDGARAIAQSPFLAGLVELDLSGNTVNDAGVGAIIRSDSLIRLQSLRLQQNLIGDAGLAVLVRSDLFRRMVARDPRLDLRDNAIGSAGAAALAASPELSRVERLDLRGNYLGDQGAAIVASSPSIAKLRTLLLARNQIGDVGALALARAIERNPMLKALDVSGNRLTHRGVQALRTAATGRAFTLDVSSNGTEPSTPLPSAPPAGATPAPPVEADVVELRRRVTHPTRRDR